MNDINLFLSKLTELAELAITVNSTIEKAALYGTLHALVSQLMEYDAENDVRLSQYIEKYRWSVAAILGYDVSNNHDNDAHLVWALGAVSSLRNAIKLS